MMLTHHISHENNFSIALSVHGRSGVDEMLLSLMKLYLSFQVKHSL